jgi:DNA-binding NarL/FixJ family response regulator
MTAAPVLLLVEPSAILCSSIRAWLEGVLTDRRILIAMNADEALRLVVQEPPAHILIEVNLPDKSGLEVIRQMRAGLPEARVIATHWYESRFFLKQVLLAGADRFIPLHRLYAELLPLLEFSKDTHPEHQ